MPRSVAGQSIRRSDARLHPATEAHGGCVARSETRTTAETRSSGPGTSPSTRCRRHDCEGRSSSPETAAAFSSPCTLRLLCDRDLPDIDAELEQRAVYPRCAPKRICDTHLADEAAN